METRKRIMELLPTGKENAISTQKLVNLTGCGSVRALQKIIAANREAGKIICSSGEGGYYKPGNRAEIEEFVNTLENRAKNTLKAIQNARRALETPEGQQNIFTGES